jgi:hypothetical protein
VVPLLIRVDPLDSVLGGARRAASSHFPVWEKAGVGEWPRRPVPRFPCPFMSSCAGSDPHPWEQRQRKADRRAAIAARMEARKAAREGSGRLAGGSRSEVWSAAATGWSPVRGPGGPWSVAQGRGGGWGVVPGSWPTGGPIHVALDNEEVHFDEYSTTRSLRPSLEDSGRPSQGAATKAHPWGRRSARPGVSPPPRVCCTITLIKYVDGMDSPPDAAGMDSLWKSCSTRDPSLAPAGMAGVTQYEDASWVIPDRGTRGALASARTSSTSGSSHRLKTRPPRRRRSTRHTHPLLHRRDRRGLAASSPPNPPARLSYRCGIS